MTILTNATTTAKCLPRWIVYPNTYSSIGLIYEGHHRLYRQIPGASTMQQCLDACLADSRCVDVECIVPYYNPYYLSHCILRYISAPRRKTFFSSTFRPIRQCDDMPTSGIIILHVYNITIKELGRVASYTQQLHSIPVNHSHNPTPNPNHNPNPTSPTNIRYHRRHITIIHVDETKDAVSVRIDNPARHTFSVRCFIRYWYCPSRHILI